MDDADLAATYVSLLPIMWSGPDTPNAQATIDLLATTAIASQIVGQVLSGFALTNIYDQVPAVGAQLNIWASSSALRDFFRPTTRALPISGSRTRREAMTRPREDSQTPPHRRRRQITG